MLFGCYRKDEAADPDTMIAAIAAILADYSPDVVRHVTDPRTGLPRRLKWVPTPAEVATACDEHMAYLARLEEGKRWAAREVEQRVPPPPTAPGMDYFSMFERHGRPVGVWEQPGDRWNRK